MKYPILTTCFSLLFSASAFAEFSQWTSADGKTAELELVEVKDVNGAKTGTFKMRSGQTTTLTADKLDAASAKKLAEWKPQAAANAIKSAYDELLEGNLVSVDGKRLAKVKEPKKPTKYYVFYHTASWCPPCRKFTPELVEFYKKHSSNPAFEIILLTSDRSDQDMEKYAVEKEMPWPHLEFSKVKKFEEKFPHPGRGIPNLVITDLEGKVLHSSYVKDEYIGPQAVVRELEKRL